MDEQEWTLVQSEDNGSGDEMGQHGHQEIQSAAAVAATDLGLPASSMSCPLADPISTADRTAEPAEVAFEDQREQPAAPDKAEGQPEVAAESQSEKPLSTRAPLSTYPWPTWLAYLVGPVCAASSTSIDEDADGSTGDKGTWLGSAGETVGSLMDDMQEEWSELATVVRHAVLAGQDAAAKHARVLRVRLGKALNSHGPSWALLSLSAVTAVTLVAVGTLLIANHRLSNQVKQRDKELARLVLRIMSLQEALQSSRAAVPVIRLTAMQPAFAITNLA